MARRKNVVSRRVLDIGSPQKLAAVIKRNEAVARDLHDNFARDALLQTQRNVETRVAQPMLAQLRIYPARQIGMKIRWTSPKQRKKVLALLREKAEARLGRPLTKEDSIAHVRTGEYGRAWESKAIVDLRKRTLRVETQNTAANERGQPIARFISGDIGFGTSRQSAARYKAPKQGFHEDRGWRDAFPIIQKYYAKAQTEAEERLTATLDRMIARR